MNLLFSPDDSISDEKNHVPRAKQYIKDSLIPGNSTFYFLGIMYSEGISSHLPYIPAPAGDAYFGFKLFRNGGFRFGWILLNINPISKTLTIKEYAINKTLNRPLKAGQK